MLYVSILPYPLRSTSPPWVSSTGTWPAATSWWMRESCSRYQTLVSPETHLSMCPPSRTRCHWGGWHQRLWQRMSLQPSLMCKNIICNKNLGRGDVLLPIQFALCCMHANAKCLLEKVYFITISCKLSPSVYMFKHFHAGGHLEFAYGRCTLWVSASL